MLIDYKATDNWTRGGHIIWQYREGNSRILGCEEDTFTPGRAGSEETPCTLADAELVARGLGHELVLDKPVEEGPPYYICGGQHEEIRTFATSTGRSTFLAFADMRWNHCTRTGELL